MPNLNTSLSIVECMPSPTSNDQQTAVEAEESGNTESGNTKIKADKDKSQSKQTFFLLNRYLCDSKS